MLPAVTIAALALAALAVAYPPDAQPSRQSVSEPPGEAAFTSSPENFANATGCTAHLSALVKNGGPPAFDKAVGPYEIAPGDVRAHRVKARDWGHNIEEFRCLGAALSVRRWSHAMSDVKPFTIEDIGKMSFPEE